MLECSFFFSGTPMMNCIDELFNLLKFLGHKEFENPKKLAEEYQGLPSVDQLPALHKLLKTYFLRRTKSQVNLGLPPMVNTYTKFGFGFIYFFSLFNFIILIRDLSFTIG